MPALTRWGSAACALQAVDSMKLTSVQGNPASDFMHPNPDRSGVSILSA